MRTGVRLGIDVGTVRVGVAASDPHGLVATPVETVRRSARDDGIRRILALATERDVVEVLVGLPRSLSGGEGPAARAARDYATVLARAIQPVPVRLVDERLSTVTATRGLRDTGVDAKRGRAVVDQVAAAIILQSALDLERGTGRPPGELLHRGGPGEESR